MGYTKDAVKGTSWIGFLRFLTKGIGFIELLVLARILAPGQFGAYGIALLALGFLETITETGVNIVLLQEDKIDHFISSAWLVSILRGILISLAIFISAPFISAFFHSPESKNLLYLISLVPLIRGGINPSVVKLQKELNFRKNFYYQSSILIVDTIVSIALTYMLKNPIGIILGLLSGAVFELFLSFFIAGPRPNLSFDSSYIKMIFHRGKWVTGATVFEYLFQNTDNIAVGRLLGASSLGVYQLAYSVAVIPMQELGSVFSFVGAPILVKIKSEPDRFRKAIFKLITATLVLCIIPALILFFYPKILVLILGAKWQGTLQLLPILVFLGMIKALSAVSYSVFLSVNKVVYTSIVTAVNLLILAVMVIPFTLNLGTRGAAVSATVAAALSLPLVVYYLLKLTRRKERIA
jgi:O-antigen/teichoic acid export membrane protein